MPRDAVTVGLVQMRMDEDAEKNVQRAVSFVEDAAARGAEVVCLPELYRTQYFAIRQEHANFDLAEGVPGPSSDTFGKLAKEKGIAIVVPIFERAARGLHYNSLVVMGPDGEVTSKYRKMHIPDDPGFNEKFYFAPGDLGFKTFATAHANMGALICWDQWYPEAARLTALAGAEVLFYPTAIGWGDADAEVYPAQLDAWRTIQRAHAIANGVFVCVANRVGREGHLNFWGNSFIADPFGRILAQATNDKEEVLVARLDLGEIDRTRRAWPFLRDRRVDAYMPISSRYLKE